MDTLHHAASLLDDAADTMTRATQVLADLDPGQPACGGTAPGRLGETGRALHAHLMTAIAARSQEAAGTSARLSDTAQALRRVAAGYLDIDDVTGRRAVTREA